MFMPDRIADALLAPCGIICLLCHHCAKSDSPCEGCRDGKGKSAHCQACEIRLCAAARGITFCADCSDFPCGKLTAFNRFYIKRYGHEFLSNAETMRTRGKDAMIETVTRDWTCECGGVVCIHDDTCSQCGKKRV